MHQMNPIVQEELKRLNLLDLPWQVDKHGRAFLQVWNHKLTVDQRDIEPTGVWRCRIEGPDPLPARSPSEWFALARARYAPAVEATEEPVSTEELIKKLKPQNVTDTKRVLLKRLFPTEQEAQRC